MRTILAVALAGSLALALAACGNTWRGMKQDTEQNAAAAGHAMKKAGDKIEDAAQ